MMILNFTTTGQKELCYQESLYLGDSTIVYREDGTSYINFISEDELEQLEEQEELERDYWIALNDY